MKTDMFSNTSYETALKIMCVHNEYIWKESLVAKNPNLVFKERFSERKNGKNYDTWIFINKDSEEKTVFYFDISGFFGRGDIILKSSFLNLPPPNAPLSLGELLGKEGEWFINVAKEVSVDLSNLKIVFKQYSSDMLSQYVAFFDPRVNSLLVTPVRCYLSDDFPILHGFYFYRLMIEHQIQHLLDKYDAAETEVVKTADYFKPVPGKDCVDFMPLEPYNYANDLINYTFYTHSPSAFEKEEEKRAFGSSLHYGFRSSLFSLNEILSSISNAGLDINLRNILAEVSQQAYAETIDLASSKVKGK